MSGLLTLFSGQIMAIDVSTAARHEPLVLDAALEVHKASSPDMTLADILIRNPQFEPVPDKGVNFGFTPETYWYRLQLHNAGNRRSSRVLEIAYPPLDYIDIHMQRSSGRTTTILTGDQRPMAEGQVDHRNYAVPIQFAANETVTLYLRIRTESSHQLPVRLWHVKAFLSKSQLENIALGLFFGMVVMLALYNGLLGLFTRDAAYLIYFVFALSFALLQASLNGYLYQYLTPALGMPAAWINYTMPAFAGFSITSIVLFASVLLDTPRSMPRINHFLYGLMALLLMAIVASFFLPYRYSVPSIAALAIPASFACIAIGFVALAQGNRLARIYLLGWSALLLGIVIKMTELFGILPSSFLTTHVWQIGLVITVMLLSMALSDRINLERKDKIEAQDDALQAREESIRALGRYQRIVENVLEGIFESDAYGRVISANAAVADMLGYASAEEMISAVTDLRQDHIADPAEAERISKLLGENGKCTDEELHLHRRDGSTFWATLTMRMTHDDAGELVGYDGILRDISESRERQKLERERAVAHAATEAKSEFLAKMSHELRTPMNAVIGFTDLAKRTDSETRRLEHLDNIDTASHSLLNIINDILDLSKVEAGKLNLESREFELRPILDRVGNVVAPAAAGKGVEIIISAAPDVPNTLVGDPLRLEQVLVNLMGNATKFTEQGEIELRVTVQSLSDESADLLFSVRDTGIGLSEEQRQRLFQPFSQADDSTTRKYGGTGLGLAICKQIVELMGGEIAVESVEHEGSNFFFNAQLGLASAETELSEDTVPSGLRVLIVDDNAAAREVYSETLLSLNIEAIAVDSAQDALLALKKSRFDAALIDWQMPEMDGLALSRQIRDSAKTAKLPIVLMTAYGHENLASQAAELDISACLEKPVKPSPLLEALLEALGEEAQIQRQKQRQPDADIPSIAGLRILLTEDNLLNQRLAREILSDAGASLDIANNGQEAIDALATGTYDLVLMDVQMPVMDGLQATRLIRESELKQQTKAHIPIIAMTANAMESDREACLTAGMDDFISKPIIAANLLTLAAKYKPEVLDGRQATREPSPGVAQTKGSGIDQLIDLPGIEINATLERIGDRPKLLVELLQDLVTEQQDVVRRLRDAFAEDQSEEAGRIAHTLKGLAANCGCTRVADAALSIEDAIKQSDEGTEPYLLELQAAMDEVASSITQLPDLTASVEDKPQVPAVEASNDQLAKLESLLQAGDFSVADQLDELAESLNERLSQAVTEQLIDAVRGFDYERALKVLQEARASS